MRAEVRYFEWPDLERGVPAAGIHSGEVLLASPACAAYGGQMAIDPQIELRVSRLENDSNSIYDLISDIRSTQQEHSRRFDNIETSLTEVVRRLPDPS